MSMPAIGTGEQRHEQWARGWAHRHRHWPHKLLTPCDVSVCAFFPPPRVCVRCVRLWCGQGLFVKSLVTSAITTAKVTAIERVQNRERLREYNHAATTIARNSGDNDSNEKLLFHGTGATDPKEVLLLPQGLGGFPLSPATIALSPQSLPPREGGGLANRSCLVHMPHKCRFNFLPFGDPIHPHQWAQAGLHRSTATKGAPPL